MDGTSRFISKRSRHDDNVRAEALAMFQQGIPSRKIETRIKEKYGEGPDHATLAEWRKQADMMGLIRQQSETISLRAGELLDQALGEIEDDEPQKRKWLGLLNAVRGTAVDKVLASPVGVDYDPQAWVLQQIAALPLEEKRRLLTRGREPEERPEPEHWQSDGYPRRS